MAAGDPVAAGMDCVGQQIAGVVAVRGRAILASRGVQALGFFERELAVRDAVGEREPGALDQEDELRRAQLECRRGRDLLGAQAE